jgi:hypothetical protein
VERPTNCAGREWRGLDDLTTNRRPDAIAFLRSATTRRVRTARAIRYQPDSCVTARDGSCTFHGGSKRARWQLAEVVGFDLSTPAFDLPPSAACPNTLMIDFW